ncbi:PucR family transcriptional regulator [Microcella daejeonensis]|uniref:PucR family transcriptional regulator n=1 Tax=Microcella daejeonensis TaxID=2994971 RepID=A0A9E8S9M6_9MICO|nr:PucR family transcriptional regulator [Microcella daejeonensis]WAB82523.1 PucR family transcriptional regulator [Microcella daejeonensis]
MIEPASAHSVTLADLAAESRFGVAVITATPEALARSIAWVHVTEVVDPRPHVRADELVCTVGAALVDPREAARFVQAVQDAGCAGVCLGLGEVHTEVPAALERACRRRGVALLSMAHGVPFRALSDALLEARLQVPVAADPVGRVMELLRADAPVADMLALAGDELAGRLSIVQRSAAAVTAGAVDHVEVDLDDAELLRWEGEGAPPNPVVLERFARVVHIARRSELAQESSSRRRVGQLMTLVVEGLAHPASLTPDLDRVGLDADRIAVSAWPEGTGALVSRLHSGAVVAETARDVLVLTHDGGQAREISDRLQLVFGYSSPLALADLALGIGEARATLMLARRRGSIAGPETLATLAALLEQQPRSRLAPFVTQLIRPLLAPEVRGGDELVSTLRVFIEHQGSVAATAAAQFVHANTVRHRLARIRAIVGRDPLEHEDRTDLGIALWAHDRAARRTESSGQ